MDTQSERFLAKIHSYNMQFYFMKSVIVVVFIFSDRGYRV